MARFMAILVFLLLTLVQGCRAARHDDHIHIQIKR